MASPSPRQLRELRRLDLNLLKLFAVLCRTRSVSRAADEMAMSQPTASQSLARLREAFHDPLFVRSGQGVTPTARALRLEPAVNQLLEDTSRLLLPEEGFDPASFDGTITVGTSDYLSVTLHEAVLSEVVRLAPNMRIGVKSIDRSRVDTMLDSHEIDLALGYVPEPAAWHVSELMFEDNFVCIFNPEQLPLTSPLSLDDYVSAPHVLGSLRGEFESIVDERLANAGRQRHVMVATSHFSSLPSLVRVAPVLATVPAHVAAHCKQIGLLRSPVPLSLPNFAVSLIWHDRDRENASHRWFRQLLSRGIRRVVEPAAPAAGAGQTLVEEVG